MVGRFWLNFVNRKAIQGKMTERLRAKQYLLAWLAALVYHFNIQHVHAGIFPAKSIPNDQTNSFP
jgi:hypothetical protein